jgi:hypothetical protein
MLLCIAACKKDNNATLPPETQTGAGTFGCKINGKVWVPRGADFNSGGNIVANYIYSYPTSPVGYSFAFSATDFDTNPLTFFSLGIDSLKVTEGLKLRLVTGRKGSAAGNYWIGNDFRKTYITVDSLNGEIYIKKFDEINLIASGAFWFDAINSYGEIIHVTEGRFDVKYTR